MAKRFEVQATVSIWVTAPESMTEDDIQEKFTWDAKEGWLKISLKGKKVEIDIEHPSQDVDFEINEDGGVCDACGEEWDENGKCPSCEPEEVEV